MIPFEYRRPESLEQASALLVELGSDARLLSGGTDLLVGLRTGRHRARVVIDLKRVRELAFGIELQNGSLLVGALTVLSDVAKDSRIRRYFPALADAAGVVGSVQIRNRATLAGNIGNASPAADTVPPLLVYGATIHLSAAGERRTVPISEFFLGPGKTVRGPEEIITAVELPLPAGHRGAAFARITRRHGVDLASINVACLVEPGGSVAFAYGAAAPTPVLVRDNGGRLARAGLTESEIDGALEEMIAQTSPIDDVRASREYRLGMLRIMSKRTLTQARAVLEGPVSGEES